MLEEADVDKIETVTKEEFLASGSDEARAIPSEPVVSFPSDWGHGLDSSLLGAFGDDATSEDNGAAGTINTQDKSPTRLQRRTLQKEVKRQLVAKQLVADLRAKKATDEREKSTKLQDIFTRHQREAKQRIEGLKVKKRYEAEGTTNEQKAALTKLQGIARQREAKQQVENLRAKKAADEQNKAVTKLQGIARQREAKQQVEELRAKKAADEQDKAATKLQGITRQREAKQQVEELRAKKTADDQDKAATKLQGIARQREANQQVEGLRAKKAVDD